jgi:hypothetical protein
MRLHVRNAVLGVVVGLGGAVLVAAVAGQGQDPSTKPDKYSPLGYYDLEAHIRAFPGTPGSLEVRRAFTARFWAFQGLAYRNGPDPLGAVWFSEGPETVLQTPTALPAQSVSGRVAALAISPHCRKHGPCRLWVATAGGGVWRTDDAMNTEDPGWQWISRGLRTNSIGSITVDPNDRSANTVYVGTGETNTPQNSNAGTGLYKSLDGGDTWSRMTTTIVDPVVSPSPIDFTMTRGISTIVIEPGRPQTMYVATTTAMLGMTAVRGGQSQSTGYVQPRPGLYKTDNGGVTWSLLWVPPLAPASETSELNAGGSDTMVGVRHVKLDPRNHTTVYAAAWNNAIHRSAPSLENGDASFKPVFAVVGLQRHRDLAMFDLTVKEGRTRIYAYNGTEATSTQGLYRLDNADVPAASLVTGTGANLVNTSAWLALSSNNTSQVGSISRALCSSQCFYDLVVAVPEGQPDVVILGGVATPTFGEPTIRSIDAGVRFHGFGRDAQNPRVSSHVDVRAVVFHPEDPDIAFVGSDGGVVRNDGSFVDISSRCPQLFGTAPQCGVVLARVPRQLHFLNRGLQTMQFYNIAIDPQDPLRRMIGGLQDNGTIWRDGSGDSRTWKPLFAFGDGTSASGFHPSRSSVLFASFQSNRYFVNFRNADQSMWVRVDDPIRDAGERASITTSTGRQFITFDHVNTDTQFTGFQHIWRTQNNGGPQAFLEANCRFPTGAVSGVSCGDWRPLGVAYPFASQTTPASTSRKPGDLTSDFYGGDREGGIIVAAERSVADGGTLWAATSRGRLFMSRNADGPAAGVTFSRIDTPQTPGRFITKIVADPTNVHAAIVSYSGFNALTPTTPGHVFRVVYDPSTDRATFTSLDYDLGDLPINTVAYDHLRGDVYAGTDFGPLVLRRGATAWAIAGAGFPEVVMVDLKIVPERGILVAATHGLGIFSLKID